MSKKITMMTLRKSPGEFIYWRVYKNREEFVITHKGKSIAVIRSFQKPTVLQLEALLNQESCDAKQSCGEA